MKQCLQVFWFATEEALLKFEWSASLSGIPIHFFRGDVLLNPDNRPQPWAASVYACEGCDAEWIAGLAREAGSIGGS